MRNLPANVPRSSTPSFSKLDSPLAYPIVIAVCVCIVAVCVWIIKKKKLLWSKGSR